MVAEQRKIGLDIIRNIAICMVMATHFFAYHPVLDQNLQTTSWTAWVFLKFFTFVGVPLFLLLTGYLQSKRECNKKHYASIIPVLLSYFVISAIILVAIRVMFRNQDSLFRQIVSIFDFEIGYAWYVEMYIGLFLLIPFLNVLYRSLSRRQKLWLIGILSFMTFLPSSLQSMPVLGGSFEVIPDFFTNLYVFAYYFIGSYIAEYQPKPKKMGCLAILFLVIFLEVGLICFLSKTEYTWWLFNSNAAITHAVVAVCLFLIFYDIKETVVLVPIKVIAACSFEMYLLSYMTDKIVYEQLMLPNSYAIFVNFALAFVLAWLLRLFLVPIGSLLRKPIVKR